MQEPDQVTGKGQEMLAAWLGEWDADLRLKQMDAEEAERAMSRPYPVRRRAGIIRIGSIRLLAPDCPATAARPVYVAVLAQEDANRWRVAPFGRFATPALPGELGLRRLAIHLQVLCLWNTAILSTERLNAAYPAGRLTSAEWRAMSAVRSGITEGARVAGRFRVGPPLVHPLDPRQIYVEEERAIWLEPMTDQGEERLPELPMAAEPRPPSY